MYEKPIIPSSQDFTKIHDLAKNNHNETRPAEYALEGTLKLASKMDNPAVLDPVIKVNKSIIEYINLCSTSSDDLWNGKQPKDSAIQTMLENMVTQSVSDLQTKGYVNSKDETRQIRIDFAFNDKGQMLRGYSSGGKPLSEDVIANLDTVFDGLLAENNLIIENGVIFKADENRQNSGAAEPEKIQAVFDKYVDYAKDKGIAMASKQHAFPTVSAAQQKAQQAAPAKQAPEPSQPKPNAVT